MLVACSKLITSPAEAREYYAAKLVGDHIIDIGGVTVTLRFNPEEIHLFTEEIEAGRSPRPELLIQRPGLREVRIFSKSRAQLLDNIVPTVKRPAKCLAAKIPGGIQIFGPAEGPSGDRLAVVVAPDQLVWFVRTMFPVAQAQFRRALSAARPAPWPPK